jgi:UDP-N-acetylmuramoylalanine--D-glutamate ligase
MAIKKISVMGLGKSGMAAVRFFKKRGYEIFASDSGLLSLEKIQELKQLEIPFETGENSKKVLSADVIVVSPGVPAHHPLLQEANRLKIPVWPEIEAAYRFFPGKLVAITGTNGKSTVTALVAHLMKENGRDARAVGNIGLPLLEEIDSMNATSWAIMEVSSFQLETIVNFRPFISSILNITQDHLDRHLNFESYVEAKARIFENQTNEDVAVLNKDDPVVRNLANRVKASLIWFGEGEIFCRKNQVVFWRNGRENILAEYENFPLPGKHNLQNLAAAVAICFASGMEKIEKGIETFRGLPHRMEYVGTVDGVDFYDDSKGTNPAASAAALFSFEKPIVLISGGHDKKLDFTPLVEAAKGRVKAVVALGKDNSKVLNAFSFLENGALIESHDMKDAVKKAFQKASKGDIVLLAPSCASFDLFRSAEERGDIFKKCVKELRNESE